MVNELTREAILELMPCDCEDHGWPEGEHCEAGWEDSGRCPGAIAEYLLEQLAKPREERRTWLGRGL